MGVGAYSRLGAYSNKYGSLILKVRVLQTQKWLINLVII